MTRSELIANLETLARKTEDSLVGLNAGLLAIEQIYIPLRDELWKGDESYTPAKLKRFQEVKALLDLWTADRNRYFNELATYQESALYLRDDDGSFW